MACLALVAVLILSISTHPAYGQQTSQDGMFPCPAGQKEDGTCHNAWRVGRSEEKKSVLRVYRRQTNCDPQHVPLCRLTLGKRSVDEEEAQDTRPRSVCERSVGRDRLRCALHLTLRRLGSRATESGNIVCRKRSGECVYTDGNQGNAEQTSRRGIGQGQVPYENQMLSCEETPQSPFCYGIGKKRHGSKNETPFKRGSSYQKTKKENQPSPMTRDFKEHLTLTNTGSGSISLGVVPEVLIPEVSPEDELTGGGEPGKCDPNNLFCRFRVPGDEIPKRCKADDIDCLQQLTF
ncbi:uncharacterized protein LOC116618503 [Nematostella vectensis]|uniref:uncharacterized protein LOC116618503 n=1 Tax=Nematostella vectensis TaxID=45351 RepID=UPI002077085B|nr:uncharacterized protein LOC116618503 [Nematostella vectensis]